MYITTRPSVSPDPTTRPSGSPDPTKPMIYIYIDNSNLFIGGKQAYADRHYPHLNEDPNWRVDFDNLITELVGPIHDPLKIPSENVSIGLYGSNMPFTNTMTTANGMTINARMFGRSVFTGKEKRVDTSLIRDLTRSACRNEGLDVKPDVHYIVVSGDWDIAGPAMDELKVSGFPLHIWAWGRGMASPLRNATPGKDLTVHFLNDILDRITLACTPPPKHPLSLVILSDKEKRLRILDDFVGSLMEWRQDEIDGHLIIVPILDYTEDDKKQQVALDRFVREAKESWTLKNLGCQVLTLEEYRAASGHSPVKDDRPRNDNRFSRTINDSGINNNNTPRSFGQKTAFRPQIRCRFGGDCENGLHCTFRHTQEEQERFETRGWKTENIVRGLPSV